MVFGLLIEKYDAFFDILTQQLEREGLWKSVNDIFSVEERRRNKRNKVWDGGWWRENIFKALL